MMPNDSRMMTRTGATTAGIGVPPVQLGPLASRLRHIQSAIRKSLQHFFHLHEHYRKRVQPRDASPVRLLTRPV